MSAVAAEEYHFERPVIIVAAPRSGSTLLFETLRVARSLWTVGGESHRFFEHIPSLNPANGGCASNRLVDADANPKVVQRIRQVFFDNLVDAKNAARDSAGSAANSPARLLEKTPKNSLRIPFLNEVFPDAMYVYLFRDPRENLSSMIEAWRSSDFVTYDNLPGWPGEWSLLLPPGYDQLRGRPLEDIVAYQWQSANSIIIDDLGKLPSERWTAVAYSELIDDPPATIRRICQFAGVEFDADIEAHCEAALPLSKYTRSAPRPDKWRRNAAIIERVMPGLQPLVERIESFVASRTVTPVLHTGAISQPPPDSTTTAPARPGRNEPCHCGSGLRFKHCHGRL